MLNGATPPHPPNQGGIVEALGEQGGVCEEGPGEDARAHAVGGAGGALSSYQGCPRDPQIRLVIPPGRAPKAPIRGGGEIKWAGQVDAVPLIGWQGWGGGLGAGLAHIAQGVAGGGAREARVKGLAPLAHCAPGGGAEGVGCTGGTNGKAGLRARRARGSRGAVLASG